MLHPLTTLTRSTTLEQSPQSNGLLVQQSPLEIQMPPRRQNAPKAARPSLGDVTNTISESLQQRIEIFRPMLRNPHSPYHQHLRKTSLTPPDKTSIRWFIDAFEGILDSIDALNWSKQQREDSDIDTIEEEFSEGKARLEELWKLCAVYRLSAETVHIILSFLPCEPHDVLEPGATGPSSFAQVNKVWRNAALHSSHLWSRLVITNEASASSPKVLNKRCVDRVEEALRRSRGVPLDVHISFPSFKHPERESIRATQMVLALVDHAKRWNKIKISLMPAHLVEFSRLKVKDLRILKDLELTAHRVPGDVEPELDSLHALVKDLKPRLRHLRLKGFEPLSSISAGAIVDKTVETLTVKEGAILEPFNLPNLRHVHIVRKDSPAGQLSVQRASPSEAQLSSVGTLVKRSAQCNVTSLSFTNPVLSTKLLVDLNKEFPGLKTLGIKIEGPYDIRSIKILTHLKKKEWLPSLETLSLWVESSDDYRRTFFTQKFVSALEDRSQGKFRKLQLYPDASDLFDKKPLKALKGLKKKKGVIVKRLEEFSR